MNHTTVVKKIDENMEAMHLLIHIGCQEKYAETQKKHEKQGTILSEAFKMKSKLLVQIESELEECLKDRTEDMKYYFGRENKDGLNVGQMALLWNEYFTKVNFNFDSWLKELQTMPEEEYCKKYSEHLMEYEAIVLEDVEKEELAKDPLSVIKQIMDMNISDEEKWKLQNIFLNPTKHRENVLELMQLAKKVMKKHEKEIDTITELFGEYWTKKLEQVNLLDFLRTEMGLDLDENPLGTTIMPSVFLPRTLNIFASGRSGKIESGYLIRIGVFFDDSFGITRKADGAEYVEEAIKNLKLLSDKSKFEILSYIKDKRAYGSELAKQLNLTTATISHHMSALLNAGLIILEKEETKIYYRANTEEIEKLLRYCENTLVK